MFRKSQPKPSEKEAVLGAFTELAPQYETTMNHELTLLWGLDYPEFVGKFVRTIPLWAGARILDVATGTAMIPLEIRRQCPSVAHVTGLDITPAMLIHGHKNVRNTGHSEQIRLVCASGMTMPFEDSSFDIATCGLGMHHMEPKVLIREFKRVLIPGGYLHMADVGAAPIWHTPVGKLAFGAMLFYFGLTYSRVRIQAELDAVKNILTEAEWRAFLAKAGFTDINIVVMPGQKSFYPWGLMITARAPDKL